MPNVSAFERLLKHERTITLAGLAALCALAWLYVIDGCRARHERLGDDVRLRCFRICTRQT